MRKRFIKKKESHKALAFLSSMLIIYFYYNPNHALIVLVLLLLGLLLKFIRRTPKLPNCHNVQEMLVRYHDCPTDFEIYIALLYKKLGYKAETTSRTNDGGKDVLIEKCGIKYAVEVKLYSAQNKISRPLIQKLHSACIDCRRHGIFITTSSFTQEALTYADKHGIQCIDGIGLEKMIRSAK